MHRKYSTSIRISQKLLLGYLHNTTTTYNFPTHTHFLIIIFSCSFCENGSIILNYYNTTGDTTCTEPHHKNITDYKQKESDFSNLLSSQFIGPACLIYQLYTSEQICLETFHAPILWDLRRVTQFNQYTTECSYDKDGNLLTTLCDYGSSQCFFPDRICSFERDIYGDPVHCTDTGHLRFCKLHECPDAFKCHGSYCIPIHMVCDMILDCPDGEDEDECDSIEVDGMFRYFNLYNYLTCSNIDTILYNIITVRYM